MLVWWHVVMQYFSKLTAHWLNPTCCIAQTMTRALNTSEMERRVGGRRLPWPTACDTHDRDGNEWWPSSARSSTNGGKKPLTFDRLEAGLTAHLKTCDVGAEERRKLATAALSTALVAHLIVQNVWLHLDALINIAMLQLNEASRNGSDIALLVGECNATGALCR